MRISLIICTRNHAASLNQTLKWLDNIHAPAGAEVEVVVVNNGSTDNTSEVVAARRPAWFQPKHVLEAKPGLAIARKSGMRAATGEIIVFTDDDIRPETQWLDHLLKPVIEERCDAVTGTVKLAPNLLRDWMQDLHKRWLAGTDGFNITDQTELVGANMAFHRRVLEQVPEFDEELGAGGRLGFGEESLFAYQLKRAGYRLGFASDAVVEHHFDESRLSRQAFVSRGIGQGRSEAYIAYHWRHALMPKRVRRLPLLKLRLWLERMRYRREVGRAEGCSIWEMKRILDISFLEQFVKESNRPRVYDAFGLRKRNS